MNALTQQLLSLAKSYQQSESPTYMEIVELAMRVEEALEQPKRAVLDEDTMRRILYITRKSLIIREVGIFIREHHSKHHIDIAAYYVDTGADHAGVLDALDTPELAQQLAEDIKTLIYANCETHAGVIVHIHQF